MRRALALAVGLLVAGVPAAHAATISVSTANDVVGNDGLCSLREAISAANLDSAPFSAPGECVTGNGPDVR